MSATLSVHPESRWRHLVPRWLAAAMLIAGLTGATLLVAEITRNWSIVPSALLLGAMTGPLAFSVWMTDRTRVGRAVAPDVLFSTFLVGGGVAMMLVGIFQSEFFEHPSSPGWLWIALTEELAKVAVPFAICLAVPKYRKVEPALALALVAAAGFAVMESLAYAISALDQSVHAARQILLERSLVTPFGHLPWTAITVVVAARSCRRRQTVVPTPKGLWGFALAVALHTGWNAALVERGWWHLLVAPVGAVTFIVMYRLVSTVHYDGPSVTPAEHPIRRHARS